MKSPRATPRRVWCVLCPTCRRPIDFSGEGGVYWETKAKCEKYSREWPAESDAASLTETCGCRERKKKLNRRSQ